MAFTVSVLIKSTSHFTHFKNRPEEKKLILAVDRRLVCRMCQSPYNLNPRGKYKCNVVMQVSEGMGKAKRQFSEGWNNCYHSLMRTYQLKFLGFTP